MAETIKMGPLTRITGVHWPPRLWLFAFCTFGVSSGSESSIQTTWTTRIGGTDQDPRDGSDMPLKITKQLISTKKIRAASAISDGPNTLSHTGAHGIALKPDDPGGTTVNGSVFLQTTMIPLVVYNAVVTFQLVLSETKAILDQVIVGGGDFGIGSTAVSWTDILHGYPPKIIPGQWPATDVTWVWNPVDAANGQGYTLPFSVNLKTKKFVQRLPEKMLFFF